jgi:hypothetical protein
MNCLRDFPKEITKLAPSAFVTGCQFSKLERANDSECNAKGRNYGGAAAPVIDAKERTNPTRVLRAYAEGSYRRRDILFERFNVARGKVSSKQHLGVAWRLHFCRTGTPAIPAMSDCII